VLRLDRDARGQREAIGRCGGRRRIAWFGVPHTSELILLSAVVTTGLFILAAMGRAPIRGRSVGLAIGIAGLVAALQVGYRMLVPPFGARIPDHAAIIGDSCFYYCLPSEAMPADLLIGIWLALAGCLSATLGGWLQAFSRTARGAPASDWTASPQPEIPPWLALAALGGVGHFVFGYTFFTFFTTVREIAATTWSGWLPMPHTGALVLEVAAVLVVLAWATARGRSPLRAAPLGALIAVLGLLSASRTGYRILQPPFGNPDILAVEIGLAAYLALMFGLLVVVAGVVQAVTVPPEGGSRMPQTRGAGPALRLGFRAPTGGRSRSPHRGTSKR
jgi:hypothetical protein